MSTQYLTICNTSNVVDYDPENRTVSATCGTCGANFTANNLDQEQALGKMASNLKKHYDQDHPC